MRTYYVTKGPRGLWEVSTDPGVPAMPGGVFRVRADAVRTARLLAGWGGKVEIVKAPRK